MPSTRSIYEARAWRGPFILILITTAGLSALAGWDALGPGLLVVQVRNSRAVRLETVDVANGTVHTGLGRIPPGESRMKRLKTLNEGIPWVYVTGADTTRDTVEVPVYLQSRSKGFIDVEFLPGGGTNVKKWMTPLWDDVSR